MLSHRPGIPGSTGIGQAPATGRRSGTVQRVPRQAWGVVDRRLLAAIVGLLSLRAGQDAVDTWSEQLLVETVKRIEQAVDRHVAGSAAGFGVNADGSTYAGAYDSSTDFGAMRIGPGMAPEAKIFAIKVFGCDGSTDVVTEAIDHAVDPNGDGDPTDHVDVINMSLGSDFGSDQDSDSIASRAAVNMGVSVVASAMVSRSGIRASHAVSSAPDVS